MLPAPARADDDLADARTAAAVSFASPRAPLGDCLRVLSEASGVTLAAGPALAEESLVGYVPRRTLRETKQALEDLIHGAISAADGKVQVPQGPGIGVDVDREVLERYGRPLR